MKIFKKSVILMTILVLTSMGISSCSNDKETDENVLANAKVSSYLKSFYHENYQLGKSVKSTYETNSNVASKSKEVDNVIITEVFVGEDTRARGYIVTEKATNDFLYFIDVDRINEKLTTEKIETNETKVFNNIAELDKYLSTDKLDYIKIAEDYSNGDSSVVANRFWGWGPMYGGPCIGGVRIMYKKYYVLWIAVDEQPVMGATGVLQEPCGEAVLGED